MKEQMGRTRSNRWSFAVDRNATDLPHVDPLSAQTVQHPHQQKVASTRLVGRLARRFALIGIVAIILATMFVVHSLPVTRSAHAAGAVGFHISGRNLLDVNGNNFIMRGISHGYAWYLSQNSSFPNIKATGANTVRVVLNGSTSQSSVQTAINLCKSNRLVCVLEDHDTTGYSDQSAASLSQAVSYWQSLQSILTGQENWVIINIGNEPWGNSNTSGWVSATKNAIIAMRNAGFKHTLMVDGPGWGQDPDHTMLNNATSVEASDSMRNTIFSVHMYGVYGSASTVDSYLSSFSNTGMPLVIGEFGATQSGASSSDNADQIMADAQSRGIGYMGWSWSGNGSPVQYLDMVIGFNAGQRSAWGNRIIAGSNGIQQTSRECSCYSGTPPPPTPTPGGGGGTYYKIINRNSGQALDISGASTSNGGMAIQWPYSSGANQQWREVSVNGGYKLINRNSGLLLDDPNGSKTNGTQLDQWNDTNGSNQWWNLVSAGNGYYFIVNQSSGLYADVNAASTANGATVIEWPGPGGTNQQWQIIAV